MPSPKYYFIVVSAKDCPACLYYHKMIESDLKKKIDLIEEVEYQNIDFDSRLTMFRESVQIDPRIPQYFINDRIPNFNLVRKDEWDNPTSKLTVEMYGVSRVTKVKGTPKVIHDDRKKPFDLKQVVDWIIEKIRLREKKITLTRGGTPISPEERINQPVSNHFNLSMNYLSSSEEELDTY